MADPFIASRSKFTRAKEHLADFERKVWEFRQLKPYGTIIEADSKRPGHQIHKVKMTQPLPESLCNIVGDIVGNLRGALDTAAYGIAVAAGKTNPKNTAFPFAGSVTQMANSLGRSKDLPKEIQSLFCGFQPYPGGNDILWALNEMCNADKHKILIPMGTAIVCRTAGANVTGFFSMPDPHVWDAEKNEMVLITLGPGAKFDYQFHFEFFIAFHEIPVVEGQNALIVIEALFRMVNSILTALEAESRRLGIVK
jgi:hypothetical protein